MPTFSFRPVSWAICCFLLNILSNNYAGKAHALSFSSTNPIAAAAIPNTTPPPEVDVGIIGAGPSGLALCHALRECGHSVRVFESRDTFRPVGAALFLYPFAFLALRSISPALAERVENACTAIHNLAFRQLKDESNTDDSENSDSSSATYDIPLLGESAYGVPFATVRYWDLLCALKKELPEEIFRFGHKLERYEQLKTVDGGKQEREGVTLHFENDMPSCTVRFLIDAGGINSATRQQLLGNDRRPRMRATYAVVPKERAQEALGNEWKDNIGTTKDEIQMIWGGKFSMIAMDLNNGRDIAWGQTDFDDDPCAPIAENKEKLQQLLDARYRDWPVEIRAIAKATRADEVIETSVAELPISWRWGKDDVTLLGDAAHAQLPGLALGVTTAFGDIEELTKQIRRHGLNRQAIRWYEINRMPVCAAMQLLSRGIYLLNKAFAESA